MFKIAVDLGYGYIKAVNERGSRVLMPSLVGAAHSRQLSEVFGGKNDLDLQHVVVSFSNGPEKEYFLGELARSECRDVSYAFDQNKIDHPATKALLAAAVANLHNGNNQPIHLVTGPPLKYIGDQQKEFRRVLNSFSARVRFVGRLDSIVNVEFARVSIFPQGGAAVYYLLKQVPQAAQPGATLALVEVGYKTTEILTVRIDEKNQIRPLDAYSTTLEIGMHILEKAVQEAFFAETGSVINPAWLIEALKTGRVFYGGKEIVLTSAIERAREDMARAIVDGAKAQLGDVLNYCRLVAFAGGGAEEIREYASSSIEHAVFLQDGQFANALGYMEVARAIEKAEARQAMGAV